MSSAPLHRLKEVFHSAQQTPPNERSAFLDQTCGNDAELRRDVDSLLESSQHADGFMVDLPAQLAAEAFGEAELPSASGRTIGRYKLLQRIGTGGMGEVYLAERADQQFKMQVAIKLIKRGMDTESVLRRFQHERQILASLEHPNIARLLDGGETEDGLPYFVMEYVRGERIDRYAEAKNLPLKERLELFRQVCGAVSYAHQHLVVHRDLKPSNILVTSEGVPKLLDFGIAKIIQTDDGVSALATITMIPALTPEYASPEQFDGAPATTLSDVYSLGAVLYELLSGKTPFCLTTRSPQDIARVLTKGEPPRPSTVTGRQPSEIRNQKSLRGDLDNIVLMAMRREAARRYRSVEQFSEDIRRHLTGLPVTARRDTLSYRTAKFVRRNGIAITAASLLVATLIAGVITTAWEARRARAGELRAERRFKDMRKLANSVLFDYHDAIRDLPGATRVRERLVKDALNYLDSLAGEAHGDPALQRELAAAYERVGDVRGGESSGSLGDVTGAVESYNKALSIRDALFALKPDDAQVRRDLASSHQKLGYRLLDTNKSSDGFEHLRKALSIYLDLTREQPTNGQLQLDLADASNQLGKAMDRQGDLVGTLEKYRAALAICEKLGPLDPRDQRRRRITWTAHESIADVLFLQGDITGSIGANKNALALGEALIAEDPLNADYRRGLVHNYQNGGDYRKDSDKAGALEYFRKAVTLDEELLAADPSNALTTNDLGYTHKRIADFLANQNDDQQALLHFAKALAIFEKLATDAPADLRARFRAATCRAGVAGMQARLGQVDVAVQECRKATSLLGEIAEDPTNLQQRLRRAEASEYLGYAYLALAESTKASVPASRQHTSAAREMFRQSLEVLDDMHSQGTLDAVDQQWAKEIADQVAKIDIKLGK